MFSRPSVLSALLPLISVLSVKAADFQVTVGGPGGVIAYNPNFVVGCLQQVTIRNLTE